MTRVLPALWAFALAGLVTAVLAGCGGGSKSGGSHPASSDASGPTVVTTFTPYTAADALTVPVTARATGQCWTSSIVVRVVGAYRCLVGNEIADPCFTPHHATTPVTVACVSAPWSSARVVTLTGALPKETPRGTSTNPWAVLLANGAHCVAATGTVQSVGKVSLNLLCPGGTAAGALDTSAPMWKVKYGTAASGQLTDVAVTAAWKG